MNKEKNKNKLKAIGGVLELAKTLGVDLNFGIDTSLEGQKRFSLTDREEVFGKNIMSAVKPRSSSFEWTIGLLRQHILTPFFIIAVVNTVLGLSFNKERENSGWIEGTWTWIIALLLILSGVALDYQFSQTRRELNQEKGGFDVTVLRDGKEKLIRNTDLLVGDILVLTRDVIVAADGLLFVDNDLFINEEIVTGESKPVKKKLVEDPFCRSGTQVTNGSGMILVTTVGEESELGQTMKTVLDSNDHADETLREERSDLLWYNKAALYLGIITFIILLIRWMIRKKGFPVSEISDDGPVQLLILAFIIIVLELPDGFLVFLLFGYIYLGWNVAQDKIILHRPYAFRWMKDISTICFDKTGTLTKNRMTVVKGWFQGTYFSQLPSVEEFDPMSFALIAENASLNSESFLNTHNIRSIQFVGNQTECALLVMIDKLGVDYCELRMQERQHIIKHYGFNSDKKMSSVIVRHGHILRLYNKGAAEMVLNKCTQYIGSSGSRNSISEGKRIELENTIKSMTAQGLRTLALTYADLDPDEFNFSENGEPLDETAGEKRGFAEPPEEDLVLLAIVGMKDPIHEGASQVVREFKKAGITVRMITGDSLKTAEQVARECGILTNGLTMEGPEFRQRVEEDLEGLKKDLPRLQVLARSSPSDKQELVELLKSIGEKVAVVGDGSSDAPALKESDIGIAMGTNRTEVAREAADLVIMNNNISSILFVYLWSRCSKLSSWGYTQFRLSVTLVVWIVVLVSVCTEGETPLSVHQFLWANSIIDTMAVLTFATETPPAIVRDVGSCHQASDASKRDSYYAHVILQSLYQITVILCTFFLSSVFERYNEDDHDLVKLRKNSLVFNIFIFMQLFNSLNCRRVFDEYNIFEGLFNSPLSCAIRITTFGLQLIIMLTPVRTLFDVTELNAWEWLYSIGVSVVVIPLSTLIRCTFKARANNRRGYQRLR